MDHISSELMKKSTGDGILSDSGMWHFGGTVPLSFDNHVSKSVPMYFEGHELILKLSDFFVGKNSLVYEVGCSTGALIRRLAHRHQNKNSNFVGIDIEQDMIEFAKKQDPDSELQGLNFTHGDAVHFEFEKADFIVAYYTIQFIPPKYRQVLIDTLYQALNWGGALVLFEKVRAPDARFQDITTQMYTDYKLEKGYSPDEILNKSRSLKRVLEPFSSQGNMDLLARAGFQDYMTIMKHINFEGVVAIK